MKLSVARPPGSWNDWQVLLRVRDMSSARDIFIGVLSFSEMFLGNAKLQTLWVNLGVLF